MDHFHSGNEDRLVLDLKICVLHVFTDVPQCLSGAAFFTQTFFFGVMAEVGEIRVHVVFQVPMQFFATHVMEIFPA